MNRLPDPPGPADGVGGQCHQGLKALDMYVDNGGMFYFHSDVCKEDKKSIQELPKKCPLSVPL